LRGPWPLLIAAGLLLLVGSLASCGLADRELTVILISLDTTRPDHLSAYGYDRPTSPSLQRLAGEGVRFDGARSTTSWTLPAHMSLFTGLPPALHEVVIDFNVLDRGRRTLGQVFKDADFRTMGVFSGPYVHGHYGFDRGFDFYEEGTQDPMLFDLTREQRKLQAGLTEHRSHTEVTSATVVDRALTLLRNSNAPRNLLFLHFFDPHYDYKAPRRIGKVFTDPAYRGPVTGDDVSALAGQAGADAALSATDKQQLRSLYDAELAWVDENIGRLLEGLKAQGRLEHTLIVVTGDHGEEFFEHGRYGHRNGLSEQTLHVPLIVWGPGLGVPAGRVVADPVAIYDILPTLIDYAGLPEEPGLYGRSLRPLVEGGSLPARPLSAALTYFPREPVGYYELYRAVAVNGLKLVSKVRVRWSPDAERDLAGDTIEGSEQVQVFDLAADPLEQHDLAASQEAQALARVAQLRSAWDAEWERQRAELVRFSPMGAPAGSDIGLSLMDQLKALGYLAAPEAAGADAGGGR